MHKLIYVMTTGHDIKEARENASEVFDELVSECGYYDYYTLFFEKSEYAVSGTGRYGFLTPAIEYNTPEWNEAIKEIFENTYEDVEWSFEHVLEKFNQLFDDFKKTDEFPKHCSQLDKYKALIKKIILDENWEDYLFEFYIAKHLSPGDDYCCFLYSCEGEPILTKSSYKRHLQWMFKRITKEVLEFADELRDEGNIPSHYTIEPLEQEKIWLVRADVHH